MTYNRPFPEVKKNFGFGCMRLPMVNGEVDTAEFCKMVDLFLENGFNYFDTAHGYLGGKSETALRDCLTSRYPRESYILVDKLSVNHFDSEEEIRPLFQTKLDACGVEYFDFYLLHAQDRGKFEKYKRCRAYETAFALKEEGKVRHVGLSFHDTADVLDRILTEYPALEVVQIQLNYADWEDRSIQSRACLEVCNKHGKPVIVMEPVKGGSLVNSLPDEAKTVLDSLNGGSYASYAIRFAASQPGVFMVLSGMGNMAMTEDNIRYMKEFSPLNREEQEAIRKVREILTSLEQISCTACNYCTERCPQNIPIPTYFSCYNDRKLWNTWMAGFSYNAAAEKAPPSTCLGCGLCEEGCPQHLPIRQLLKTVEQEFAKK